MGTREVIGAIGATFPFALAALPWLSILPIAGPLLHVVALVYAFWGWGKAIGFRIPNAPPILVALWGIAACACLAGPLLAVHLYRAPIQIAIVYSGCGFATYMLLRDVSATRERIAAFVGARRWWFLPVAILVGYGVFQILGAAGDVSARPYDDDGNVIAQIARMAQTGALGDAIGYPRNGQLGGQVSLLALVGVVVDVETVRMLDPIGLVLAIGLAIAQIRPRDPQSGIIASAMVIALLALPMAIDDLAPMWLSAAMLLALLATIESAPAHVIGIVAAAVISMRLELAPFAIVAVLLAWRRRDLSIARIAIAALVPLLGFVMSRVLADGAATAWRAHVVLHIAIALGSGALLYPILAFFERGITGDVRTTAAAPVAASLGMVFGMVASSFDYGSRFVWPLLLAYFIPIVVAITQRDRIKAFVPYLFALICGFAVLKGNQQRGRFKWPRRILDMMSGARFAEIAPNVPMGLRAYADLLAKVPEGATVAVWVAHPERLDYTRYHIVDIRTPRNPQKQLEAFVAKLRPAYILVEDYPTLFEDATVIFAAHGARVVTLHVDR